jgi:hypothetical protein
LRYAIKDRLDVNKKPGDGVDLDDTVMKFCPKDALEDVKHVLRKQENEDVDLVLEVDQSVPDFFCSNEQRIK